MNINELRKQSYSARARKTATLDTEFDSWVYRQYRSVVMMSYTQ